MRGATFVAGNCAQWTSAGLTFAGLLRRTAHIIEYMHGPTLTPASPLPPHASPLTPHASPLTSHRTRLFPKAICVELLESEWRSPRSRGDLESGLAAPRSRTRPQPPPFLHTKPKPTPTPKTTHEPSPTPKNSSPLPGLLLSRPLLLTRALTPNPRFLTRPLQAKQRARRALQARRSCAAP